MPSASNLLLLALQEKKLREKIKDECKETIRQIEAKIQEEQQLNKKLEHKNLEITKSNISYFNCKYLNIFTFICFGSLIIQNLLNKYK